MALDPKIGAKCVLYAKVVGGGGYTEIDLISDLSFPAAWDEAESSARISPVKTYEPTMIDFNLTGRIRKDFTDAGYLLFRNAFLTRTALDVMVLDGPDDVNDVTGYRLDMKVFSMGEDQALGNVLFNDVALKPIVTANPPQSVVVALAVPVFTEFTGD